MNENPSDKFFWNDWDNEPTLKLCSLAAQGLWMRILCIASRSDGYVMIGKKKLDVADIATYVGRPLSEISPLMEELERNGVYSVFRGMIYSRRIVRARKASRTGREHGLKGGNPALRQPSDNQGKKSKPITTPIKVLVNPENDTPARVSPNSPNSPIAASAAIARCAPVTDEQVDRLCALADVRADISDNRLVNGWLQAGITFAQIERAITLKRSKLSEPPNTLRFYNGAVTDTLKPRSPPLAPPQQPRPAKRQLADVMAADQERPNAKPN